MPRDMARLESVLAESRVACCGRAERAARDLDDLRVLGRASSRAVADQLQLYADAVGVPAPVLFHGRLADMREDGLLELEQLVHAVGAHVDTHARVAGDGVDRSAAAHDADGEGGLGRGGRPDVR